MGEILSHAEVEAILAAIEPSRPEPRPEPAIKLADVDAWARDDAPPTNVLQGAALKFVHVLHDGICQRWKRRLQDLLRADIELRPVGACQSTAAELLATVPAPQLICRVRHQGSAAESLLVWDGGLAQLVFARMLGSPDGPENRDAARALTAIEQRLLTRLNDAVLGELAAVLDDPLEVVEVHLRTDRVPDSNALLPSVWFSFELSGVGAGGLIHLGIPAEALPSGQIPGSLPKGVRQVSVQLSANLAVLRINGADLAALQVGDLVQTDLSPGDSVLLQLDGRTLCPATIGMHLGRKALRLTADPGQPH